MCEERARLNKAGWKLWWSMFRSFITMYDSWSLLPWLDDGHTMLCLSSHRVPMWSRRSPVNWSLQQARHHLIVDGPWWWLQGEKLPSHLGWDRLGHNWTHDHPIPSHTIPIENPSRSQLLISWDATVPTAHPSQPTWLLPGWWWTLPESKCKWRRSSTAPPQSVES